MAPFCLYFFIFSSIFSQCRADLRTTKATVLCGSTLLPPGGNFEDKFFKAMQTLSILVRINKMGTVGYGSDPRVLALTQCTGDLNMTDCFECFNEARYHLLACHPYNSGRVYLDGCFLRYDNYNFFQEAVDNLRDKVVCQEPKPPIPDYQQIEFMNKAHNVIRNATINALENNRFGVAEVTGGLLELYGLAQCWSTVDRNGCRTCLENAASKLDKCFPRKEGTAMNAGCYLRYSTDKFVDITIFNKIRTASRTVLLAGVVVASLLCIALAVLGGLLGYIVLFSKREGYDRIQLPSSIWNSGMNWDYETIMEATESFASTRKLGQGAAASVFKASLSNGKTVAVKRMFFNSRQWADEFFNEVTLINGIKHKNLVRLLGCSIEGPESLLIYEYLPKGSLDQIIFDKNNPDILTWQQRFDIILGIAEGLAYLHSAMSTRIIHRDIKCSNILLDENLTAKIGDFGLIRRFGADKSHISTGIAGTLGYMAPEYLIQGHLTEKADVYSFGVLVIEIVCARRNSVFLLELGSVLYTVWENYKSRSLPDSVDPRLRDNFPPAEASHVLQMALLCTQSSAKLRPSMSQVVEMLTNKFCTLPSPKQPPFMNSSVINGDLLMASLPTDSEGSNASTHTVNSFYSAVNFDSLEMK